MLVSGQVTTYEAIILFVGLIALSILLLMLMNLRQLNRNLPQRNTTKQCDDNHTDGDFYGVSDTEIYHGRKWSRWGLGSSAYTVAEGDHSLSGEG